MTDSLLTVLVKFILPMALLCAGGLLVMHLVEKATPRDEAESKRPAMVSVLVAPWAFGVGRALFVAGRAAVAALTGRGAETGLASSETLAWFGVSLLATGLLVAACYALFQLRRSAVPLFVGYVLAALAIKVVYYVVHPDTPLAWRDVLRSGEVIFGVVTLVYAFHLKSRSVLA